MKKTITKILAAMLAVLMIASLVACAKKPDEELEINVYEIKNEFYGHTVTVAGLVTGGDLIRELKGRKLGQKLIIPDVMLRSEGDLFLDNVSLEKAQEELGVKICPVRASSGDALIEEIISMN